MKGGVDAHVHLWDPARLRYPWLDDLDDLNGPARPSDLPRTAEVDRCIFIQADCAPEQGLEEAQWVAGLDWPARAGIVAFVPVDRGFAAREDLARMREVPGVVGVRRLLQNEPTALLESEDLRNGLQMVGDAGLSFDLCVRWEQLSLAAHALEAVSGLTVVLDHVGKPPIRAGLDSDSGRSWLAGLRAFFRIDGSVVKLSGLSPESDPHRPLAAQVAPFLRAAADLAGPDRLLIGSDWPVSYRSSGDDDYAAWFAMVRDALGLAPSEWDAVAQRTAERVYSLD